VRRLHDDSRQPAGNDQSPHRDRFPPHLEFPLDIFDHARPSLIRIPQCNLTHSNLSSEVARSILNSEKKIVGSEKSAGFVHDSEGGEADEDDKPSVGFDERGSAFDPVELSHHCREGGGDECVVERIAVNREG